MRTNSAGTHRGISSAAALVLTGGLGWSVEASAHTVDAQAQDLVAVAILDQGRGVALATPGQETSGRRWRLRSFDTSQLPQPLVGPVLSASGTKLFLKGPEDSVFVIDLMKQERPDAPRHYVDRRDPAINGAAGRHTHRLPSQRFVVPDGFSVVVYDDVGEVQPMPPSRTGSGPASTSCSEADLRACLQPNGTRSTDATIQELLTSLRREAETANVAGRTISDWEFFRVTPDPELYVPVLQVVRNEEVFPSPFETLERLADPRDSSAAGLYERYRRQDLELRRRNCTIYYRVRSLPGSWLIEYWLYYPFDVGGISSHLHDPEHVFVEVDKLGGVVHRIIGAGHGFLAGNNTFSTDRPLARRVQLPLFVFVEFNKHATAPDIDRDGIFTPGIDENEYRERSKVWGVRDVVGTNNNHLLPYDRGMTLPRSAEDYLASVNVATYFPHETKLSEQACCRLVALPAESPVATPCHEATTACAVGSVMLHPDFQRMTTILKDWVFPQSFLRATYGVGPGLGLHSVGVGYSVDLDRTPGLGRFLPLPGRVGIEAFAWRQDAEAATTNWPMTAGLEGRGVGYGVRYEQFLSNLFGIHSGVRIYSPPISDVWITFGPMVEVPLVNKGNVNFMTGLAFSPSAPRRFEMKVGVGFWKRRAVSVGMAAQ
jgi:hypothetical protein